MASAAKSKPVARARKDPPARALDGVSPWARLENKTPGRHYVLIHSTTAGQVEEYIYNGYEAEVWKTGGVRIAGFRGKPPFGEEMLTRGMLVMSCSAERKAEIDDVGVDGNTGWDLAEQVEDHILDRSVGKDLLRGIGAGVMAVENTTKRNVTEII